MVAAAILADITREQHDAWSQGKPADWATEAFALARDHAYGILPQPSSNGVYVLDARYVAVAVQDVRLQLAKAGVRLGAVLNEAFKNGPDHSRTMFSMAAAIPLLD